MLAGDKTTYSQLKTIVKKLYINHNEHKIINAFHKTPIQITVEDVKNQNTEKEEHNHQVESRNAFEIDAVVKITNKKENLDKARVQKWSNGNYVIIGKEGRHYAVSPVHVPENMDIPVYFRKLY